MLGLSHIPDEVVHDFVRELDKSGTSSAPHERCALDSSTDGDVPDSNDSRDQSPFGGPYSCRPSDGPNAYQGAKVKAPQNDEAEKPWKGSSRIRQSHNSERSDEESGKVQRLFQRKVQALDR